MPRRFARENLTSGRRRRPISSLMLKVPTVSNSPNPSRVYFRLCKHRKPFLLLKYCYRFEKSTNETEFILYRAKMSLIDADYRTDMSDIRAQFFNSKLLEILAWAQLFEGRLALNPGLNLTRVSFSCVQKHFLG